MVDHAKDAAMAKRALINTVSNYFGKFLSLSAWLFFTPKILQHVGSELFGLWVLVGSLMAYGSLFDFGIGAAITKYVAEFHAKREPQQARALIATALWLYVGLGTVVVVVAAGLALVFPQLFAIAPDQRPAAMWLVSLAGIGVGLSIPCAAPAAVLQGLQRFDIVNLLSAVGTLLSAVGIWVVLYAGGGVIGLALVSIVVTVIMQIPAIWFIRRLAPDMPFSWRGPDSRLAKTVATFSSSLFLVHLGGQLEAKTDEIVIGRFMPLGAITPYSLARRISTLPQTLTDQFLSLLLPLASSMSAENDKARVRTLYVISTRLALAVFIPIGLCLVVLARPILTLWVGDEYGAYAHLVIILTVASLIDTSQWPAGLILQGMARHKPLGFITLASGVSNLLLSLLLISSLGLTGVALGTLIPTALFCLLFVLPYALKVLEVKLSELIVRAVIPASAPAIPALIVLYGLRELLVPQTLAALCLIAASSSLVFTICYLALRVNEFERRLCRQMAGALIASVRLQWQRAWL